MALVHERAGDSADRRAWFVAALCLAWPDGHTETYIGRVDGTMVWPPRGDKGFGYDPMFIPEGGDANLRRNGAGRETRRQPSRASIRPGDGVLLRVILWVWVLGGTAFAAGSQFTPAPGVQLNRSSNVAKGVLVWVPGTYGRDQPAAASTGLRGPGAAAGMDVWCFDRDRGDNPLDRGAAMLARHVQTLREQGYRQVIIAGHSRGAWIALTVWRIRAWPTRWSRSPRRPMAPAETERDP